MLCLANNSLNYNLREWYEQALQYLGDNYFHSQLVGESDVPGIFSEKKSKRLIRECVNQWTGLGSRDHKAEKIYSLISYITDFRSKHTVSAFLLGVIIKNVLSLNIECSSSTSSDIILNDASFDFLWPIVCLTHDVGYKFERRPKTYIDRYPTLEDFCTKENVEYNLLEVSSKAQLFKNYYQMRIKEHGKVDHGITGGVLLYDALMTFGETELYSNFSEMALAIAETVASHNIWVSNTKNRDIYTKYNLNELILDDTGLQRQFLEDNSLQFLLGFIDTIDPIKAFCNTEGGGAHITEKQLLEEFSMRFYGHQRIIEEVFLCRNCSELCEKYKKTVKGIEDWLGVFVTKRQENVLSIAVPNRIEFINTTKNVG